MLRGVYSSLVLRGAVSDTAAGKSPQSGEDGRETVPSMAGYCGKGPLVWWEMCFV